MKLEDFYKYVEHEINWLKYYSYRESKKQLTTESSLYDVLVPIGYTKRTIPLDRRCSCGVMYSNLSIDKANLIREGRGDGKITPLEVFWRENPDRRQEVIDKLQ